ncbi:TonB-dependent receptor [Microbulbifer sp.]|uniref:TonB-dependent receptor n=1 Tax=Microbulbifer sp. TaxID=1908541 RepID=UPI002F95340C
MNRLQRAIRLANISLFTFGAMVALPTMAQDESSKESQRLEEVEVTGYRGAVKKSLDIKRNADVMMDAISAEDVGKFPDQTVADALQRVAGVSVEKSEGEADRVSIRGTPPHLNMTLFNGQHVATALASADVASPPSRSFNYSLLPSELINTLEVHKSPQAKIEEGSIGGTVIVKTRSPLSTASNYTALSVKDIYQESSSEHSPAISGFYSWKNEGNDFGVNLSYVSRDNRIQRDTSGVGYRGFMAGADGSYLPDNVRATRYNSDKDLRTATLALEWQANDSLNLQFNNLVSKVDQVNQFISNGAWNSGAAAGFTNVQLAGDTIVAADVPDAAGTGTWAEESLYSTNYHEGGYETRAHDLKVEFTGEGYTLAGHLGHTAAEGDIVDDQVEFEASTNTSFEIIGTPSYTLDAALTPADYSRIYTHRNIFANSEDETYAQLDLNLELQNDWISSVDVGVKHRDHMKKSDFWKEQWIGSATLDQFTSGNSADDFMGKSGSPDGLWDFDAAAWKQWTVDNPALRANYRPDYSFEMEEKVTSTYVQANLDHGQLHGNVGVRYARTDATSRGYQMVKVVSWNPDTWTLEPGRVDNDYSSVLPSLNLAYDLQDDMILRFAAAKVISRPDYDNLAMRRAYAKSAWAGAGYDGLGAGGNPELEPYRANQYDFSAEYYFTDSSIVSLALFYKDIESYIDTTQSAEQLPDENGVIGLYNITIPVNGIGGRNQGVELTLQHDLGNGFGLLANYTYSDADMLETAEEKAAGIEKQLPANSSDTYNATAYYEDHGLSARLAYNYRSRYYTGTNRNGLDKYADGYGQVDANISYQLTDNVSLVLQLLNLTDSEQTSFWDSTERVGDIHQYGRRVFAGINAKF